LSQADILFDHIIGAGEDSSGTDRPIALAAFRLTTNSNFVEVAPEVPQAWHPLERGQHDAARPNISGVLLPKEIRPPLWAKYRSL
jgi:hypothetical protein